MKFLLLCVSVAAANLFERQTASTSVSSGVSSSTSSIFTVATPGAAITVNSSNHDLSQHFCRLWRHQSRYLSLSIRVHMLKIMIRCIC